MHDMSASHFYKKVSVLVITYNQERFIAQAIDSILMQNVNFDYEIVIGEDCSQDNTRGIITSYKTKYPDKIRLLLHSENLGQYGKLNLIKTLQICQGQYVALLEGDDYWISPDKLQRQVDFLDNHSEYALCYHNVVMLYENKRQKSKNYYEMDQKATQTLEDLLVANIPTCSVMFRKGLFEEFPDWFFELIMSDWLLNILNAQHGKIGYMNEVMAAYRLHQGGVWALQGNIRNLQEIIKAYDYINAHLNFRYNHIVKRKKYDYYFQLASELEKDGDLDSAKDYMIKCIIARPFVRKVSVPNSEVLDLFFRLYTPTLYGLVRSP